jgi:hypothetical protein
MTAAADRRGHPAPGNGFVVAIRAAVGAPVRPTVGPSFTAARAGTSLLTQSSRMVVSFAVPGEAGNAVGSSAGMRSITVRRVSAFVPWRA